MKTILDEGAGHRRLLLLLTFFSLALYIDTLSYDFVWDDDGLIVNNQYTKYPRSIPTLFGGCPRQFGKRLSCRKAVRGGLRLLEKGRPAQPERFYSPSEPCRSIQKTGLVW